MERHAFDRRLTACAEFPNDNQDLHHGANWVCLDLCREPVCELPMRIDESIRLPEPMAPLPHPVPEAIELDDLEPLSGTFDAAPVDPPEEVVSLLTISTSEAEKREEDALASSPCPAVFLLSDASAAAAVAPDESGDSATTGDDLDRGPLVDDLDADLLADEPIEIVDELSFDDALDDLPPETSIEQPSNGQAIGDPFAQLVAALRDVACATGGGDEVVACLEALFGQTRLEGVALGERAVEALISGGVIARSARGFTRSGTFTAKVVAWQGILRGDSEDFSLPNGGALEPLDEWAADLLARIVGPPARADGIRRDLRRQGIAAFGLVTEAA